MATPAHAHASQWASSGSRNHDLCVLYGTLWQHRDEARSRYGNVLTAVRFHAPNMCPGECSIGALTLLWEHWPEFSGDCPDCRGRVLGIGGSADLAAGKLAGICSECGLLVSHAISSLGELREAVYYALHKSAFRLVSVQGEGGNAQPLLAVLQELGVENLPGISSPGLLSFQAGFRMRNHDRQHDELLGRVHRAESAVEQLRKPKGPALGPAIWAAWTALVVLHACGQL